MRICLLSTLGSYVLGNMLARFITNNIKVDSVLIDSKSPSKRELAIEKFRTQGKLKDIPVDKFSKQIPFKHLEHHCSETAVNWIKSRKIDLVINCGTPRILKQNILTAPKLGILNCHPGLLPNFKGCTCVEWAIYLDEKIGNTVYFMTEGIDEGPIVIKEAVKCKSIDNYSDIRVRVYNKGFDLYIKALIKIEEEGIIQNSLSPQKGGKYFSPISDKKMKRVIEKLNNGEYKYQTVES